LAQKNLDSCEVHLVIVRAFAKAKALTKETKEAMQAKEVKEAKAPKVPRPWSRPWPGPWSGPVGGQVWGLFGILGLPWPSLDSLTDSNNLKADSVVIYGVKCNQQTHTKS
jgi:hypothetical protein